MTNHPTFLWHDYETFGVNPVKDQPVQFAGQRTDSDLNPVGDPWVFYCKPSVDRLPAPEACLINGMTPQFANEKGLLEPEFIARIREQMSVPGTCSVGYNSIKFDDEVTRHTLFRNFQDPYAREWEHDCSRWDIIGLARMTAALRPDGIEWPTDDQGHPVFRLTELTSANDLEHAHAHDALSDVYATISLARLLRDKQPRLFRWLLEMRRKQKVSEFLGKQSGKLLVHTDRFYSAASHYTSLVLPLCYESGNPNSLLVYNLRQDPSLYLDLSKEELHDRLFQTTEALGDPGLRLPVTSLKINQCPAIAPIATLDEKAQKRIGIDKAACVRHAETIRSHPDFASRVEQAFSAREFPKGGDVDQSLYDDFLDSHDRHVCQRISAAAPDQLASGNFRFHDPRLPEMLFRYRARNWPESLKPVEQEQWQAHCHGRYEDPDNGLEAFFEQLSNLRLKVGEDTAKIRILDDLEQWADCLLV